MFLADGIRSPTETSVHWSNKCPVNKYLILQVTCKMRFVEKKVKNSNYIKVKNNVIRNNLSEKSN